MIIPVLKFRYKTCMDYQGVGYCFRKVTIAEGLSTKSALLAVEKAVGLIGQIPESIKEGSLLPETYFYSYNDTKSGIIKRMQEAMNKSHRMQNNLRRKHQYLVPIFLTQVSHASTSMALSNR